MCAIGQTFDRYYSSIGKYDSISDDVLSLMWNDVMWVVAMKMDLGVFEVAGNVLRKGLFSSHMRNDLHTVLAWCSLIR